MSHHQDVGDGPGSLTDWQKLGTVSTWNGMLAIVAPYYANTLAKYWNEQFLPMNDAVRRGELPRTQPAFREVELEQITTSVTNPDGYKDSERAFLFNLDNGAYDVEGRFCDLYGGGHMTLCELRLRLHLVYDDDEGRAGA